MLPVADRVMATYQARKEQFRWRWKLFQACFDHCGSGSFGLATNFGTLRRWRALMFLDLSQLDDDQFRRKSRVDIRELGAQPRRLTSLFASPGTFVFGPGTSQSNLCR